MACGADISTGSRPQCPVAQWGAPRECQITKRRLCMCVVCSASVPVRSKRQAARTHHRANRTGCAAAVAQPEPQAAGEARNAHDYEATTHRQGEEAVGQSQHAVLVFDGAGLLCGAWRSTLK